MRELIILGAPRGICGGKGKGERARDGEAWRAAAAASSYKEGVGSWSCGTRYVD